MRPRISIRRPPVSPSRSSEKYDFWPEFEDETQEEDRRNARVVCTLLD